MARTVYLANCSYFYYILQSATMTRSGYSSSFHLQLMQACDPMRQPHQAELKNEMLDGTPDDEIRRRRMRRNGDRGKVRQGRYEVRSQSLSQSVRQMIVVGNEDCLMRCQSPSRWCWSPKPRNPALTDNRPSDSPPPSNSVSLLGVNLTFRTYL